MSKQGTFSRDRNRVSSFLLTPKRCAFFIVGWVGVFGSRVSAVCLGRRKQSKGYVYRYVSKKDFNKLRRLV